MYCEKGKEIRKENSMKMQQFPMTICFLSQIAGNRIPVAEFRASW